VWHQLIDDFSDNRSDKACFSFCYPSLLIKICKNPLLWYKERYTMECDRIDIYKHSRRCSGLSHNPLLVGTTFQGYYLGQPCAPLTSTSFHPGPLIWVSVKQVTTSTRCLYNGFSEKASVAILNHYSLKTPSQTGVSIDPWAREARESLNERISGQYMPDWMHSC
jgi:hypothetical protein